MIKYFDGACAFLSNFYLLTNPVRVGGIRFYRVENAFQASKTTDRETRRRFVDLTPGQAKKLGKEILLRKDWDKIKLDIMKDLVYQKFTNNPSLARELMATYPEELVEHNHWSDTYWGVCNGNGENHLGLILMDVRWFLVESYLKRP